MVGEVFERDAAQTALFMGGHKGWDGIDTHLDSVFDFSLWNASLEVFTNKTSQRATGSTEVRRAVSRPFSHHGLVEQSRYAPIHVTRRLQF